MECENCLRRMSIDDANLTERKMRLIVTIKGFNLYQYQRCQTIGAEQMRLGPRPG